MRVVTDESDTMHRSFLMKKYNYSHCPLKKRPIQFIKEDEVKSEKDLSSDDNSEPENLCTRPQDLSMASAGKTLVAPPPAIALISSGKSLKEEKMVKDYSGVLAASPRGGAEYHQYSGSGRHHPDSTGYGCHFLSKPNGGGPLEPLNLNTAREQSSPTWPRAVPAHYPPNYVPPSLNFFYPQPVPQTIPAPAASSEEMYPRRYYPSPSPPAPPVAPAPPKLYHHEQIGSPPHAFTPFNRSHAHVPVICAIPHEQPSRLYAPSSGSGNTSPLSPASSSNSSNNSSYGFFTGNGSPPPTLLLPPVSPEDLSSSPGSVSEDPLASPVNGRSGSSKKSPTATVSNGGTSGSRYKCSFCSKCYSTYSGLSKHQQFHCSANEDSNAAKKTFSCKYCEKVYVSLGALKMHIRTHTLPCKCKLCGKAFSRPWLLQGHIRTHTGEKPFSCPHCNRAFADRSNLRAHLQTHSDIKKYSCPTCSKTFSRMSLLSKHNDGGCPGGAGSNVAIASGNGSTVVNENDLIHPVHAQQPLASPQQHHHHPYYQACQ